MAEASRRLRAAEARRLYEVMRHPTRGTSRQAPLAALSPRGWTHGSDLFSGDGEALVFYCTCTAAHKNLFWRCALFLEFGRGWGVSTPAASFPLPDKRKPCMSNIKLLFA